MTTGLLVGCTTARQIGYFFSFVATKPSPDYDLLEADRAAASASDGTPIIVDHPPPYWTSFRGPNGAGRYDEQMLDLDWSEPGPVAAWRRPVGEGYGSFVVADGLAFTLEQRRDQELVAAYHLDTGDEIWTSAYPARFHERISGAGPRSTPSYHDGVVYAVGGSGHVHALDARTGRVIWQRNVLTDTRSENLSYGVAASPLVAGDRLIVLGGEPSGEAGTVAAYALGDGQLLWTAMAEAQAYSSPALLTLAGRRQIVALSAERVAGVCPESGSILWDIDWRVATGLSCAQPVQTGPNRIVVSGGYGKGATLIEVAEVNGGLDANVVWTSVRLKNRFNSSVFYEGFIYGFDEAILVCVDPADGSRVWKAGRYGYGQLLIAQGCLIVLSEDGDLALVSASPDGYVERARVRALEGKTLNVPALAHGRLLVRNTAEMACFDLRVR